MTVLPITLTIAAAAALINIWIGERVGRLRRLHHISIGAGGNELVETRMRAHSNFAEYAPVFLILLGLVELAVGSPLWLWILGVLFIIGRILHPLGMERPAPNVLRIAGMMLSLLPTVGLALYAVAIPYLHRSERAPISYVQAQAPASTLSPTNGFDRRS